MAALVRRNEAAVYGRQWYTKSDGVKPLESASKRASPCFMTSAKRGGGTLEHIASHQELLCLQRYMRHGSDEALLVHDWSA